MSLTIAAFETVVSELGSGEDPVFHRGKEITVTEVWYAVEAECRGDAILDEKIGYWGAKGFVKRGTMRGLIRDRRLSKGLGGRLSPARCPSCGRFLA